MKTVTTRFRNIQDGAVWRHKRTGQQCVIVAVANRPSSREDYPITVVYRLPDGTVWSCPAERFMNNREEVSA